MNSIKKISFIILFVLLGSSTFAQKNSSGWSLLFSWDRFNAASHPITTVFDVDGDETNLAGIGAEFLLAPQLALQVGLRLGMLSYEVEQGTTTIDNSMTEYGVSFGPVWYFRGYNVSGVRPYLGGTINIGGVSATTEAGTFKEESSASSFGVTAFIGADLHVIEGLRVGAGYGLNYTSYPSATYEVTGGEGEEEGPSGSLLTDVFHLNCKILF